MKKIILLLILIISLFTLSGCKTTIVDEFGVKYETKYGFVILNTFHNDKFSHICYDPTTKICYILIFNSTRAAISPNYIINDNGESELAIYGENYFNYKE